MTEVNAHLIAINLLFKFEVSSFIRSKDMTGDPKCRNGPLAVALCLSDRVVNKPRRRCRRRRRRRRAC